MITQHCIEQIFSWVLGKLADRAFSRQGKNEKFSRQFCHN